jgi:hypothetical protein
VNKRTYEVGGGKYTAVQNDDGSNTWNVLDVPIIGEIPKGGKKNLQAIDKAWLEGAVKKHQDRLKGGFRPPLHIEHHEPGVTTERAGEFIPQRVGKLKYQDRETHALFADLIRIPDQIFRRIEKGELPYLSVEIEKWDAGEIASLALMDDDSPYFRFPNVTIGTKIHSFAEAATKVSEPMLVTALQATGTGGLILCKMSAGIRLNDDGSEKQYDAADKSDKSDKSDKDSESDKSEKPNPADKSKNPETEVETEAEVDGEGGDTKAMFKQILKLLTVMVKGQSGVGALPTEPKDDKTPVEQEKPMADPKDKAAASVDADVKLATLAGEVDGLKAKVAKREHDDEVKLRADKAISTLSGHHLTKDIKEKILLYAGETAKPQLLDAYVESVKLNFPKDPPPTFAQFDAAGAGVTGKANDPEADKVLAKYANESPEVIEKVRTAIALHARSKRMGSTASMEKFVEAQMFATSGEYGANGRA